MATVASLSTPNASVYLHEANPRAATHKRRVSVNDVVGGRALRQSARVASRTERIARRRAAAQQQCLLSSSGPLTIYHIPPARWQATGESASKHTSQPQILAASRPRPASQVDHTQWRVPPLPSHRSIERVRPQCRLVVPWPRLVRTPRLPACVGRAPGGWGEWAWSGNYSSAAPHPCVVVTTPK